MAQAGAKRAVRPKQKTKKKEKKRDFITEKGKMDSLFLIFVFALLAFGLVMLFSASYAYALYYHGNSFHYIGRQAIIGGVGVILMFAISKIDYHIYRKLSISFFIVGIILLILVLFTSGDENGIHRWISIGGQQFQPSEFMKFAMITLFASMIAANYKNMQKFTVGVLPFVILLGIIVVLMYLEPHLSGIILMCSIAAIMLFVGGTKPRWFVLLGSVGAAGLLAILLFAGNYMGGRAYYWLHPFSDPLDNTLQTDQSLLSIGSGRIMGRGLGFSYQKYMYLPEPQNDFIFAIVCEELGVIGAIVVILLFVIFAYRGFGIASKSPDMFGTMLCIGIISQIAMQALLNIAVVTNTVPNTGISLPFFSYGGTALLMQLCEMGVVLNVSRYARLEKT